MKDLKPGSFLRSLASVGPGIVVAGSVIGSGELVNTPVQAAKFGFVLLWAVLLACVIKVFAQIELARHCLVHNRTTVEALNEIPGPKWRGTSWTGLVYMLVYFASMMPVLGIIALLGELMHGVWPLDSTPATSARIWSVVMALVALGLLWQGWYDNLEKLVMLLVGGFALSVGAGIFLIQGTSHRISSDEFLSGLQFSLGDNPAAGFAVISLLGALGTAANELFMYPYWILEKGYARELGDPLSEGWIRRARHWINMIRLDVGLATAVATIVTAGFFLLGAAVMYRQGMEPKGIGVVDQISSVYTETYGDWSKLIFLIGAFCTLFSTLVVVVAASGRMWTDLLASLRFVNGSDPSAVRRCHQVAQAVWLVGLLLALISTAATPVTLITVGHWVLGAIMTPLLMICICWLAFHTDRRLRMGRLSAAALVGSVIVVVTCVLVSLLAPLFRSS